MGRSANRRRRALRGGDIGSITAVRSFPMRYFCSLSLMLAACGSSPVDPSVDVPLDDRAADVVVFEVAVADTPAETATPDADAPEAAVDVAVADATDVGDAPDAAEASPSCLDRDGDGYGSNCPRGPDCDDSDGQRHPGAVERCNGLDDDCDGTGDLARSDALDAWCTNVWRTAYTRRNMDPARDTSSCLIPPVTTRPGQLNCHPTRVACAAMAANPSSGCVCFTADDVSFVCP